MSDDSDLHNDELIIPSLLDDPILDQVPVVDGKKELGGCRLDCKIGQGGMAAVYKGRHKRLNVDVAVKVLPSQTAARDSRFVKRFMREAQTAATISHTNLVRVYDVNEQHGVYFIVQEYVSGGTVAHLVRMNDAPLPELRALEIIRDAAAGLAEAHSHNIIHRDIKPDNILIDARGRAKVSDLGLAKALSADGDDAENYDITQSGTTVGTPTYMSPEQCVDSKRIDHRTDIYSLGVSLFYILTRRRPFMATSLLQLLKKITEHVHPDPRQFNPSLSSGTVALINCCMQKDPDARFESADAMIEAIDRQIQRIQPQIGLNMSVAPQGTDGAPDTTMDDDETVDTDTPGAPPQTEASHTMNPNEQAVSIPEPDIDLPLPDSSEENLSDAGSHTDSSGSGVSSIDLPLPGEDVIDLPLPIVANASDSGAPETPSDPGSPSVPPKPSAPASPTTPRIEPVTDPPSDDTPITAPIDVSTANPEPEPAVRSAPQPGWDAVKKSDKQTRDASSHPASETRTQKPVRSRKTSDGKIRVKSRVYPNGDPQNAPHKKKKPHMATGKARMISMPKITVKKVVNIAVTLIVLGIAAFALKLLYDLGPLKPFVNFISGRPSVKKDRAGYRRALIEKTLRKADAKVMEKDWRAAGKLLRQSVELGHKLTGDRQRLLEKCDVFSAFISEADAALKHSGKRKAGESSDNARWRNERALRRINAAVKTLRTRINAPDADHDLPSDRRPDTYRKNILRYVAFDVTRTDDDHVRIALPFRQHITFIRVPAGEFTMGADSARNLNAMPPHTVRISTDFFMAETELTRNQYAAITGRIPNKKEKNVEPDTVPEWTDADSFGLMIKAIEDGDMPVTMISFDTANALAAMLNVRTPAVTISLPTEAQWEYAAIDGAPARPPVTPAWCTRNFEADSIEKWLNDHAVYNADHRLLPVKSRQPTSLGIYDQIGSVWEWCRDYYSESPSDISGVIVDPVGPPSGEFRLVRGGSYKSTFKQGLEVSPHARRKDFSNAAREDYGIRLVLSFPR